MFSLARVHGYPAPLRIVIFLLVLVTLWLPLALPFYWLLPNPNHVSIITLLILYTEFIGLVRYWGHHVHGETHVLQQLGLDWSSSSRLNLLKGLSLGLASILLLFGLQGLFGWLDWTAPTMNPIRLVVEGLVIALGIGFAEELFFRGWLLDELQRDYRYSVALVINAVLFAAVHLRFITLPALVVLGATLVWAKRAGGTWVGGQHRDRLGLPIGLHAGLVWGNYVIEVGQWVHYTQRVPEWITGIGRNPLAGVLGVLSLMGLAVLMRQWAKRSFNQH